MEVSYSVYGACREELTHWEMLELQEKSDGELLARAENRGCEPAYVEIARWNGVSEEWQRFVFAKVMDFDRLAGESDIDVAKRLAKSINDARGCMGMHPLIHRMPNYEITLEVWGKKTAVELRRVPDKKGTVSVSIDPRSRWAERFKHLSDYCIEWQQGGMFWLIPKGDMTPH